MKSKVSGLIMTRNEERLIAECIEHHAKYLDEIIVLDDSTDKTPSIAEKMGAHVHRDSYLVGADERRNLMQSLAKNDWVLHIDADELFDISFMADLTNVIRQKNKIIGYLSRFNLPFGKRYPDLQPRILDKTKIEWYRKLHELPVMIGETRSFNSIKARQENLFAFTFPIILHRITERSVEERIERMEQWRELLISNKGSFEDWEFEVKNIEEEIKNAKNVSDISGRKRR